MKGFLGGLVLLAFFDSCVKSLSKGLRQEVPKVYISACFDGFKQALGDIGGRLGLLKGWREAY